MTDKFIFKHDTNEYLKSSLNPSKDYIEFGSKYIEVMKDIPRDIAIKKVIETVKDKTTKKNPLVEFNKRDSTGDVHKEKIGILTYIKDTQQNNEILVPSLTAYYHPSVKKSMHSGFTTLNKNARNEDKKKMLVYEQSNDVDAFNYYNNMQTSRKLKNNSLSGAYKVMNTTFYHPANHNTLTSITRCITSIGNTLTESLVAGNKLFFTYEDVINYITVVICKFDKVNFTKVMKKYNLVEPEPEYVFYRLKESFKDYFNLPHKETKIKKYLSKLTGIERAAVLYTNDMYNIRLLNEDFIRQFITDISTRKTNYTDDPVGALLNAPEGVANHTHNLCSEEIKGLSINYKKIENKELEDLLGSTCKYVTDKLIEYKDFIQAMFVTKISPINVAYIKQATRKCIILSDTDSTCATYDEWVEWYFKGKNTVSDRIGISSSVMTITTQVLDHYIKVLSGNMNIAPENFEELKMKNEFYWNSFITTNAGKHYFADIAIKEGNVFLTSKSELKGVSLILSTIDQIFRDYNEKLMTIIKECSLKGEKIDLHSLICLVANVEREIIEKVKAADTRVLSKDKIKDAKSYSLGPEKSPYQHYTLWRDVFSKKYGDSGKPIYEVIKVPTILKSPNKIKLYLESIEDKDIRLKLTKWLEDHGKKQLGTIRPPTWLVQSRGLPREIHNCVDYRRIVFDNCLGMYSILETLGFYRPKTLMISELGPY